MKRKAALTAFLIATIVLATLAVTLPSVAMAQLVVAQQSPEASQELMLYNRHTWLCTWLLLDMSTIRLLLNRGSIMITESIITFIHMICGGVAGVFIFSILLGRRLKLRKRDILAMWMMFFIPWIIVTILIQLLHLYVFKPS